MPDNRRPPKLTTPGSHRGPLPLPSLTDSQVSLSSVQQWESYLAIDWTQLTDTPVTLAGYGIADAYTKTVVDGLLALKAPLASPTFTGVPTAPTAAGGTNTTQIATTAFVTSAVAASPVTSVFGRTGAVVAATNDYNFTQLAGSLASGQLSGDYTFPGNVIVTTALVIGADPGSSKALRFTGDINKYVTTATQDAYVNDGNSYQAVYTSYSSISAGIGSVYQLRRARGSQASPVVITAGDSLGFFRGFGYVDGAFQEMTRFGFETSATDTVGVGSYPGRFFFSTVASGGTTLVRRWTLESAGHWWPVAANSYDQGSSALPLRNIFYGGQLTSSVATGTAPFVVTSTTVVANLHAASADTSTTQSAGNNSTSIATTAYVDRATGTTANSTAAPHNTTSTTGVMMGLALAYTPTIATKALITITGAWANATLADGVKMQIRYGTGTAPTNTAGTTALTGTAVGSLQSYNKQAVATDQTNFTLCFPITGLTIGTTYWIDMSLGCITGGTASVTTVDAVALETT